MTLIVVGVVAYVIMAVLFLSFLGKISIFEEEEKLCSEPMASCASCHKC